MFGRLWSSKGSVFRRGFHVGRSFSNPRTEDLLLQSICVNLKQRKWIFLEKMIPQMTCSLVGRVICMFKHSPQLALEFHNWTVEKKNALRSVESSCNLIHALVSSKRYDDALLVMGNLMGVQGKSPLEVLDALTLSYNMCNSSPAVFDALVRACTQVGDAEGAYEVIKKLQSEGTWVTVHAWNNFLSLLLKLNDVDRFWQAYKEMVSYGYVENVYTSNLVVYAFCKVGRLLESLSAIYRSLKRGIWPNIVSFNMIIDSAFKMGAVDFALKLVSKVEDMSGYHVKPDSVTYNILVNGFCKMGNVDVAEELENEMLREGIEPNVRTYATLIDGYSRVGSLKEAFRLCDEMVEKGLVPNSVIYNSVIHWLFIDGDYEEASQLFSDMIDKHICPDKFTYSSVIEGLCRNGCLNNAFQLFKKILENNQVGDAFSHNILINYFCRSNNLAGAKQLLANMYIRGLAPDIVTFGTMIDRHCKEGNMETALQLYDKMRTGEKPTLSIYNSLMNGFCKDGLLLDPAIGLMDALKRINLFDVVTYNTLMHGCCKSGKMDEAFSLFSEMRDAGILANNATYNTLINALCKFGDVVQAKELMKMMVLEGLVPDYITYTILIISFSKRCTPEEVIELHDYMVLKGVVPDKQTHQSIVRPLVQDDDGVEATA